MGFSRAEGIHWGVLLGLALFAGGALFAALASVVPGRDRVAGVSRAVASLGVAWVVALCLFRIAGDSVGPLSGLLAGSLDCAIYAVAIGIPSLWIAASFLSRGVAANPRIASGALAGATGLGAFAVHAACPDTGGYHVLLSHGLTPMLAAGLFALPLAALIARVSRAKSRSLGEAS